MKLAVIEARLYRINASLTGTLYIRCTQDYGRYHLELMDNSGVIERYVSGTKNEVGTFLAGMIAALEVTNRL